MTVEEYIIEENKELKAELQKAKESIDAMTKAFYILGKSAELKMNWRGVAELRIILEDNDNSHDNDLEILAELLGIDDLLYEARQEATNE